MQVTTSNNQAADNEKQSFVYADQPASYDCEELAGERKGSEF